MLHTEQVKEQGGKDGRGRVRSPSKRTRLRPRRGQRPAESKLRVYCLIKRPRLLALEGHCCHLFGVWGVLGRPAPAGVVLRPLTLTPACNLFYAGRVQNQRQRCILGRSPSSELRAQPSSTVHHRGLVVASPYENIGVQKPSRCRYFLF